MVDRDSSQPGFYEMLQVHPAAPLDLITAAYWRLANGAREAGPADRSSAVFLHQLTRAYQTLADPRSRADYDRALGIKRQPPAPRIPHFQRSPIGLGKLFGKGSSNQPRTDIDYYEILRVDSSADPAVITEARDILRKQYVRLVLMKEARPELLDFLEEAHAVTTDPLQRAAYDARRKPKAAITAEPARGPSPTPSPPAEAPPPAVQTAPPVRGQAAAPAQPPADRAPPPSPPAEQELVPARDVKERPTVEAHKPSPPEGPPARMEPAAAEPETEENAPPVSAEPGILQPQTPQQEIETKEVAPVPSAPGEPLLPRVAAIVAPVLGMMWRAVLAAALFGGQVLAAGAARAWQGARWFAAFCGNALLSATDSLADRWVRRRNARVQPDDEKLLIDRLTRATDVPEIPSDGEGRSLGEEVR